MKYLILLLLGAGLILAKTTGHEDLESQTFISEDVIELVKAPEQKLVFMNDEIDFWSQKLQSNHSQYAHFYKLGMAYYHKFGLLANIDDLYMAAELLETIIYDQKVIDASILRSLTRIYISLHEFVKAEQTIKLAIKNGEKKRASLCSLFDVEMELGKYANAKQTLQEIYMLDDFDYLIREAKWKDHEGQLEQAISLLEQAMIIATENKNQEQLVWLYSNLGDFYMHNNEIEKAYSSYLNALSLDDTNYHTMKSIAWLAYSKFENIDLAKLILNKIGDHYHAIDLNLFQAELAEYENNHKQRLIYLNEFMALSDHVMFRIDRAIILAEEFELFNEANALIEEEIKLRDTPETRGAQVRIKYLEGDFEHALELASQKVLDKTCEPIPLFQSAQVFKIKGQDEIVLRLKAELMDSKLELGPLMMKQIEEL